ncbi:GNAT family N-acetyltransferase [Chenggangzhangella methanolivorans]|uniref:N-acetyltransferase n=1 Tax=Chenggangzhangella methanolivorans TaxID=1437009 RepID=A0A9E6RHX9_9HYPH|nr:N-acetyltransferase [Chenggangzhangella methanolivorans]QZO01342.1 N-acetyltransferase [Chenggangzhangella methanolivorans]
MTSLPLTILHEQPADGPAIERLQERAFGPGRYARSAYRLREGVAFDPQLSFTAQVGTLLVGSNRMTPITIGGASVQLLGPLVVDPAFMNRGIGRALIHASLEAAAAAGHRLVMLVGDEPYYARMGFARIPEGRVTMPGPVDPARMLWRELAAGAAETVGGRAWKAF